MNLASRRGRYLRVADPGWHDPLDGAYSARHGGRWNPAGSFPVCYLNADIETARANARHLLDGRLTPIGLTADDLDPSELPMLVDTDVPDASDHGDVVSDEGCTAVGLPVTYPLDIAGLAIPWDRCQPIGSEAWDSGRAGIACRSAATGAPSAGEELAWFQRNSRLTEVRRRQFPQWYGTIDW